MIIKVIANNLNFEVAVTGEQTILDVLKSAGVTISAPCGGKGTCRKCQVLLRFAGQVSTVLACTVKAADGMVVEVEQPRNMLIDEGRATSTGTDRASVLAQSKLIAKPRPGLGVAFDLGTTTLVAQLYDLTSGALLGASSQINPQVVFGGDVISRIEASMAGELGTMHSLILDALNALIDSLLAQSGCHKAEITAITLAGNTVMQHIALNLAPDSIGVAPFEPLTYFGGEHTTSMLPAPAWFAPCVSGYVGGDITAGVLATALHTADKLTLLMDLGTNGEMVLGDKNGMVCCATAAGPVFEGANITFGMPALPGAISKVAAKTQIDFAVGELPFVFDTIANAEPLGICGSGLIDAVAWMLDAGVVDATGLIQDCSTLPEHLAYWLGKGSDGQNCFYLTPDRSIAITQTDVRNLQLAKAAIWSGTLTMLAATERSIASIEVIKIAGGFGKAINLRNAARCGIFAPALLTRAQGVGNTAIEGASCTLLAPKAQDILLKIAQTARYIELSTSAEFNNYFIEQMLF